MGAPEDLGAIAAGYPRLAFTNEAGSDLLFNVDMTRRAWGEKNKEALTRFVRAMASAYAFMNDPSNRDEIVRIIVEAGHLSPAIAAEIFAPYLDPAKNVLPRRGELDLAAFGRVLSLMTEAGVVPSPTPSVERFVDLTYLNAAGIH